MKDPLDLQAWIIARHARQARLWEALGISRPHLWRIQVAACMPSHDLAARIASLMAEDGITTTAGGITDHQAARIAERCFHSPAAPVRRVTGFDIPYPPPKLEKHYLVSVDRILDAVDSLQWEDQ